MSSLEVVMKEKPEGDFEIPSEPCLSCYKAEWYDLYGVFVFCCDLSICIFDKEKDYE